MTISFNTATINAPGTQTTSQTLTIPAGVLAGDVMLLVVNAFFTSGFTPTVASTGTAFTQIGSTEASPASSGFQVNGAIFYAIATASDAGKVITVSGNNSFWALAMAAYTGASNSSPIDVSGGAAAPLSGSLSVTCPAKTTGVSGDWAIYLSPYGINPSFSLTDPSGTTQRENSQTSGIGVAIADSNGSVGAAGTSIGGGLFSCAVSPTWLTAFTIGLAPAGAGNAAALTGGAGILTAAPTTSAPAALTGGAGTLAAAATLTLRAAAALTGGAGTLAAAGGIAGAAHLTGGAGTLTAAGIPVIAGAAHLTGGAGTLTAAGTVITHPAAALHGGAGTMSITGGSFTLELIASITGHAGTDQFGNSYRAGITEYDPVGGTLVNLLTGMINLNALAADSPADNDGSLTFKTFAGAFQTSLSSPWPNAFSPCVLNLYGGAVPEATFSGPLKAVVSGGAPEVWHAMTLGNGWANTGSGPGAMYRLTPENEVQISASLNCSGATTTDGTVIATLPAAYRPNSTHTFGVGCDELRISTGSNNEGARFSLNAAGQLTCFGIAAAATNVGIEIKIPLDI